MTEPVSKKRKFQNNIIPKRKERKTVKKSVENVESISKKIQIMDQISPEEAAILRNLVVDLRNPVLPQHEVERHAGSRVPSEEEKDEFRNYVPNIKKGAFSKAEDKIIMDNWEAFCKLHDWDESNPKPFLCHRHDYQFYMPKLEERKKFVQFLADKLPDRTLYSVYHRFRNLYDPHRTKKYSFEEDKYIIEHIEENKNVDESRKFADLAKVLKRTRASVWRRYRLLSKKRKIKDEDSD